MKAEPEMSEQSHAERFERARRNRVHPMLADFASVLAFELDDFQVACLP